MLDKVKDFARKWHMLKSEDRVVVGVSGGADSICLVLVLLELQKEIGFELIAVHVNHGIRGKEADDDEAYVRAFCKERGILCESYFADVELIAKNRKQSTEEAGRNIRRDFFEKALREYHGNKIALAHHQNDSAETFLLNLARGTGLKGLGGIAPVRGNVIRPLLCVQRNEIEEYLQRLRVPYRVDDTNGSDAYTRNRIRNHVIPYLEKEINSQTVTHMNETMEQIRRVQDFLEEQVRLYRKQCVTETKEGYLVLEDAYREVPEVIKPLIFKWVLTTVSGREKDLEAVHLKSLSELFEKQTGRKVDLPYRMEARRTYRGIEICLKEELSERAACEIVYDMQNPDETFQIGDIKVQCRLLDPGEETRKTSEKSHTAWFDCDIIKDKISFRTRRPGDYITIHPDGRTQKLKSYFINEKIPYKERDNILLAADGNHILWVAGYRQSCVGQIQKNTKRILEIQIK